MSHSNIKQFIDNRVNLLSLAGPVSVVLTVLALVVKESPFYIDLSMTALLGLLLASRFHVKGLIFASSLLTAVLAYNFFFENTPLTLWELGLSLSLEFSFVIAALAGVELKCAFQEACKITSQGAFIEIEQWKQKIEEVIGDKESLAIEAKELKAKALALQDEVKTKAESADMFERLLQMAKDEMLEQSKKRELFENQYLNEKINTRRQVEELEAFKEAVSFYIEEVKQLKELNQTLEKDLNKTHLANLDESFKANQKNIHLMDAELKIQALKEDLSEKESQITAVVNECNHYKESSLDVAAKIQALKEDLSEKESQITSVQNECNLYKERSLDAGAKIQALGEQLEGLIDQLKDLQKEKEDLEKALEAALAVDEIKLEEKSEVKDTKELARVWGLHNQLRTQFDEKSRILNQTRQELFKTGEAYLELQKITEAATVFDEGLILREFEAYILQQSQMIQKLEFEISCLENLINNEFKN